ncbi:MULTISPECIES: hypothetical protein [Clostridium]|uniref:hypothetical protein n=1 Tax=Clostridium TaxID=1485 RepID=UPI0008265A54|nr:MULTISPECIES: hypothetical protein [Clostridium]PJI07026.1 hypothetical protein CUB90_03735 [Clostridium sp. CT7]
MSNYVGRETIYDYLKNENIPDGIHTLVLHNNTSIDAEIYNFNDNIEYSASPTLGDNIADTKMLILIYHKNLTIDKDVIFTPQVRKKGMCIYCKGILTNNGDISMTARGANAEGKDVYLLKNGDGSFEYVPAAGGIGGSASGGLINREFVGIKGADGTSRATAGGGSGSCYCSATLQGPIAGSGSGGIGTAFSGGAGGGSAVSVYGGAWGGSGSSNGGAGGYASTSNNYSYLTAGGGAGNPAGNGDYGGNSGENGTGGLLIIYCKAFNNCKVISANGSNGGNGNTVAGGASGGGSINIFCMVNRSPIATGIIATGGIGGAAGNLPGGNGGNGSITITKLPSPFLIVQDEKYYSIKNNVLTLLGIPTDDIQKEQWFNDYGIDDLKTALLTHDSNSTKLIDKLDDKFQIRMMKPNN